MMEIFKTKISDHGGPAWWFYLLILPAALPLSAIFKPLIFLQCWWSNLIYFLILFSISFFQPFSWCTSNFIPKQFNFPSIHNNIKAKTVTTKESKDSPSTVWGWHWQWPRSHLNMPTVSLIQQGFCPSNYAPKQFCVIRIMTTASKTTRTRRTVRMTTNISVIWLSIRRHTFLLSCCTSVKQCSGCLSWTTPTLWHLPSNLAYKVFSV